MPAVAAAAVPALVAAASGTTIFGLSVAASAIVIGVANLALGFISKALTPEPDIPNFGSFNSIRSTGATQQFRQAVTERRIIYGEARVSGPIVFAGVTDNNKYLHLVIALASHEVEEIGEVLINDVSITDDMIDGSNIVDTGKYNGLVRIKKHLGTAAQTADTDLSSEVAGWTSNHRLRGIAYLYLRFQWDRDTFPSGIPNISAWVKGKNDILDDRDSTNRWTPNVALMARDYLIYSDLGIGADTSTIDTTEIQATANTCEEYVTVTDLSMTIGSADDSTDIISVSNSENRLLFQTGDRVQLTGGSLPGGLSTGTDYYIIVYHVIGS